MVETWEGFSDHFVNPHEIKENMAKMDKLVYASINDYIIKMDALNYRIRFSEVPWHQKGLPCETVNRMTHRALEPSDTAQFIELLRRADK